MSRRIAANVAALTAVSVIFLSGCFSYVEKPASTGSNVRITVAMEGGTTIPVAERLPHEGVLVQGAPVFALQQRHSAPVGQFRETVRVDTLWISEDNVQRVEVRRLSLFRTSLGTTLLGLAAYATFQKIHNTDTRCRSCLR